MQGKTIRQSRTEQVQILTPATLNGYKRLFGGRLMEWIDVVAAVTARRHSGKNVTTAAIDSLEFKRAAHVNDTLVLIGEISHVGRTSMEVTVKTYIEALDGSRTLINQAFVIMVALDERERPTLVPPIVFESEEEHVALEEGKRRAEARRNQSKNAYRSR